MADLTFTASSVQPTATTTIARGTAGAAINPGQVLYADAGDSNKLKLAIDTSSAAAAAVGIALNGASAAGQPIEYATAGEITVNGMTQGTVYVVGHGTAGAVAPAEDLHGASGRYGTIVGISTSGTNLRLAIKASGVTNP